VGLTGEVQTKTQCHDRQPHWVVLIQFGSQKEVTILFLEKRIMKHIQNFIGDVFAVFNKRATFSRVSLQSVKSVIP